METQNVNVPKAYPRDRSKIVRYLTFGASSLALGATALGLAAQIVEHLQRPAARPEQRTKAGSAMLALTVLRAAPGIIRSARTLGAQAQRLRGSAVADTTEQLPPTEA